MIKVTREFATVEEAIAFLQGANTAVLGGGIGGTSPNAAKPPAYLANMPAAHAVANAPAQPTAPAMPAAPTVAAPAPAPAAANSGITQAQIAAAAQAYSKAHKPAATKAVFAQFGITKISDASPAIYPQLLQALTV